MTTVSLATVRALVNYLSAIDNKKIQRSHLLNTLDLTEPELNQTQKSITSSDYENLFILAEKALNDLKIGFDFGREITPDRWGILGYIAFTSPTLEEALISQRKYQSLVGNIGTPLIEQNQVDLILKWMPAYHCNYHVVEEIITGWTALASKLSLNNIRPNAVYFTHSFKGNNEDIKIYQAFFQCELFFEHDFNGIKINKSLLKNELITFDQQINQALCQQADNLLNNLVEQSPVESIKQFIINELPLGVPEIEDAAKQLQLSVRTLQRKLSDHQQTFSAMVDNIRQELAMSYLKNTNTKIIYIAQMLGFSEQSSFQRAFKRWTDQTPKQYRNK